METENTAEHPAGTAAPNAFQLTRGQNESHEEREAYGQATAVAPVGESLTRQEFKEDTDINILLARFGVNTQVRNDMQWTEIDYTTDLQKAYAALDAAKRADTGVPPELRDKYPNYLALMSGIERGEYQKDLADLANQRGEQKKREELQKRTTDIRELRNAERQIAAEDAANAVMTGRSNEQTPKS